MTVEQWLLLLAFGSIVGIFGQFLRVIAGLKKISDEASATQTTIADNFDSGRFYRSILIGSVAGFVAAFSSVSDLSQISHEVVLGIMAAGYVGADFIEAFVQSQLPKSVTTAATTQTTAATSQTTAANSQTAAATSQTAAATTQAAAFSAGDEFVG